MPPKNEVALIGVLGSGQPDPMVDETARRLGAALAREGWWIICGGLGGVMTAVCEGARSEGGFCIGVLPGVKRSDANPWIDLPIVTGMSDARNIIIARSAHACVALPGSHGTQSEIAFCLKFDTPVLGLHVPGGARVPHPGIESVTDPQVVCQRLRQILAPQE